MKCPVCEIERANYSMRDHYETEAKIWAMQIIHGDIPDDEDIAHVKLWLGLKDEN